MIECKCEGARCAYDDVTRLRDEIAARDKQIEAQFAYLRGLIDGLRDLVPPTNAVGKQLGPHARDSL